MRLDEIANLIIDTSSLHRRCRISYRLFIGRLLHVMLGLGRRPSNLIRLDATSSLSMHRY